MKDKDKLTNHENANYAAAINYLYLRSGISEPTEQDNNWAAEAIRYANIDYWIDKPITNKEYANKRKFEIKSFSYFMSRRNQYDIDAVRFFKDYEYRELYNLRKLTLHHSFNCTTSH